MGPSKGNLRLEPTIQQRDHIAGLNQNLISSFQDQGLELPRLTLFNDSLLLGEVRKELKGCIENLEFGQQRSSDVNSSSTTGSNGKGFGTRSRQTSCPLDIPQAEDILLADLLLCSTESYRFQASNVTTHDIPFQLGASFRQANLILHHLYSIGKVGALIQYAFAQEGNYYVPDAKGFHVASPDESVVVIEYRIPSKWSNKLLDDIYYAMDGTQGETIALRAPDAKGRPMIWGLTGDTFVDEVLYHVSLRSTTTVAYDQSCFRLRGGQWGLITNGQKTLAMRRLPGTDSFVFSRMAEEANSSYKATFLQSILAMGVTASKATKADPCMYPTTAADENLPKTPSDKQVAQSLWGKQVSYLRAD